jgi:hypothetical protein
MNLNTKENCIASLSASLARTSRWREPTLLLDIELTYQVAFARDGFRQAMWLL